MTASAEALPLSRKLAFTSKCKICGAGASLFDVVDFNKCCSQSLYPFGLSGVPVYYSRCSACDFIFTNHFDDWTPQNFATAIYNADYTKVDGEYELVRPTQMAEALANVFPHARDARILDYGSGSGVFADKLKALGFGKVVSYDPFSNPARPVGDFDLITCFEVIEHAVDPHKMMRDILSFSPPRGVIVLTTGIQPAEVERERAFHWYISPRNGHVCMFSRAALSHLAAANNRYYYVGSFHIFAPSEPAVPLPPNLRPLHVLSLRAPVTASPGSWHPPETLAETKFRWTATSSTEWKVDLPPQAQVEIAIPFLMEVTPGFAENCFLSLNGTDSALKVSEKLGDRILRTNLSSVQGGACVLTLRTPEPLRPADIRPGNPDKRTLGLAIGMA